MEEDGVILLQRRTMLLIPWNSGDADRSARDNNINLRESIADATECESTRESTRSSRGGRRRRRRVWSERDVPSAELRDT